MSEVLWFAPDLPHARVGGAPDFFDEAEQHFLQLPCIVRAIARGGTAEMQSRDDLAIDIELQLALRAISDAHRFRPLIAGKPRDLQFGQPALPSKAIYDLQLLRLARSGAQQPGTPGL